MLSPASGSKSAAGAQHTAGDQYTIPRWYACRTRSRAEKRAEQLLVAKGVPVFLPVVERVRQWADRKKRVAFPLFPGYVFAQFALGAMHRVLSTPGVASIVRVSGYPTPLREEELESVRILVAGVNAGEAFPEPAEYLEVGQQVIVREGAFAGMRGLLLDVRGHSCVLVRLSVLRQAVSVELPREILRRAPD